MSFKFGRQWSVPHGPPPACKAAMACADHWLVESHIGRERWAVQMDDVCITLVGKFGDRLACLCDCFIAIGRPIERQVRDHQRATVHRCKVLPLRHVGRWSPHHQRPAPSLATEAAPMGKTMSPYTVHAPCGTHNTTAP